jgi:hypothetical protein
VNKFLAALLNGLASVGLILAQSTNPEVALISTLVTVGLGGFIEGFGGTPHPAIASLTVPVTPAAPASAPLPAAVPVAPQQNGQSSGATI